MDWGDDKARQELAAEEKLCKAPGMELHSIFVRTPTNDGKVSPSIHAKGENTMFDAKYNALFDSTWFRIAVNCALFAAWAGVAYGSLAAR